MTYDPVDTNDDGVVDADVDNESVSTDNLNLTPIYDSVTSLSGGGSTTVNLDTGGGATKDVPLGTPVIAVAVPNNDPGNDHGYETEIAYWDDDFTDIRVKIDETENDGGGDARVVVWEVGV